eukprot:294074-Hanusia_phi.AAC.1
MFNPEMFKLAQEQLSRMSPEQMAAMQVAMLLAFSPLLLLSLPPRARTVSPSPSASTCRHVLTCCQRQMASMDPATLRAQMAQAQSMMAGMSPEQIRQQAEQVDQTIRLLLSSPLPSPPLLSSPLLSSTSPLLPSPLLPSPPVSSSLYLNGRQAHEQIKHMSPDELANQAKVAQERLGDQQRYMLTGANAIK